MNVVLCGSMQFAREISEVARELEKLGHKTILPKNLAAYAAGRPSSEKQKDKIVADIFRHYYREIEKADAILVVNLPKNGVQHYLGGNALIEMAFAHVLQKKIYLLYPIPQLNYSDEIFAMRPTVLNGKLFLIE